MGTTEEGVRSPSNAARSVAFDRRLLVLGRIGYAAQGVVWLLLGWLALQLALGSGGGDATSTGALSQLGGNAPGRVLLVVMAVGLVAYAVWQVVEALWGYRGTDARERAGRRVGCVAKAGFALLLTVTAVRVATAGRGGGGGDEESAAARVLAAPGGVALLLAVAVGVVGVGAYWVVRGATASFREKLAPGVPDAVVTFGRVGHVARGVAVGVLGVLLGLSAVRRDPEQAGGLDVAFTALLELPLGVALLGAVAVGLMCFGIFQILAARWIRDG